MMLGWTMVAGLIGGYISHKTRPVLDSVFTSDGMQRIAAYSLGSLVLLAFFAPTFHNLEEIKSPLKRLLVAYILASASVGGGVTIAYGVDALRAQETT